MGEPIGLQSSRIGPNVRWATAQRRPLSSATRLRFMSVREVAAELRVSKPTIYGMIHRGEIHAVRAGKQQFRITEPEVIRYLREGPRTPEAPPEE